MVMPCTPSVCSASLTLSSRCGRMIASIFFIAFASLSSKSEVCLRGRLGRRRREGRLLVTRVRVAAGNGVQAEIVAFLAVLRQVESGHLILAADADADNQVDDFKDDE